MVGDSKEKQLEKYVDQVLADDILSDEEQDKLFEFARSLGIDLNRYMNQHPATQDRVVIAGVNAGRFPGAAPPYHILVKPDEKVLVEAPVSMLKEVADRAWQGGFSGFSFPITRGVRYRVGQTRGHMQQVGTKVVVTDAGWLSVTSARIVFSGKTSTREIHYAKLVNLTVFAIGVTECIAIAVSKGQDVDQHPPAIPAFDARPQRLGEKEMNGRDQLVAKLPHPEHDDRRLEVDVGRGAEHLAQTAVNPAAENRSHASRLRKQRGDIVQQWLLLPAIG